MVALLVLVPGLPILILIVICTLILTVVVSLGEQLISAHFCPQLH